MIHRRGIRRLIHRRNVRLLTALQVLQKPLEKDTRGPKTRPAGAGGDPVLLTSLVWVVCFFLSFFLSNEREKENISLLNERRECLHRHATNEVTALGGSLERARIPPSIACPSLDLAPPPRMSGSAETSYRGGSWLRVLSSVRSCMPQEGRIITQSTSLTLTVPF